MHKFVIGKTAVYYGKGVGLIVGMLHKDPNGYPAKICVLELAKSTAHVRVDHPTEQSIRQIMETSDLKDIFTILEDHNIKPNQTTWNRRYRGYVQNIKSGKPTEVAEVLRDLELIGIQKSLSFGESKIYGQAKDLIVEEGAYTLMNEALDTYLQPFSEKREETILKLLHQFTSTYAVKMDKFKKLTNKTYKEIVEIASEEIPALKDKALKKEKFPYILLRNTLEEFLTDITNKLNKILCKTIKKFVDQHLAKGPIVHNDDDVEPIQIFRDLRNIELMGVLSHQSFADHPVYTKLREDILESKTQQIDFQNLHEELTLLLPTCHQVLLAVIHAFMDTNLPKITQYDESREPEKDRQLRRILVQLSDISEEKLPELASNHVTDIHVALQDFVLRLDVKCNLIILDPTKVFIAEKLPEYKKQVEERIDAVFAEEKAKAKAAREAQNTPEEEEDAPAPKKKRRRNADESEDDT